METAIINIVLLTVGFIAGYNIRPSNGRAAERELRRLIPEIMRMHGMLQSQVIKHLHVHHGIAVEPAAGADLDE